MHINYVEGPSLMLRPLSVLLSAGEQAPPVVKELRLEVRGTKEAWLIPYMYYSICYILYYHLHTCIYTVLHTRN